MRTRTGFAAWLLIVLATASAFAQGAAPEKSRPAAKAYTPNSRSVRRPRPAGHLHQQGRNGIPLERPAPFEGRKIDDVTGAGWRRSSSSAAKWRWKWPGASAPNRRRPVH
jgi:hypothetical protein